MNGTVLNVVDGAGILLDDQGNRYSFGQGDVKSGVIRNGSKVNFVVEGNRAKEIYIMAGGNPFDSLSQGATNLTGGSEIKTGAYIAAAGAFLSLFGLVSSMMAFMGFGLELYGVYRLAVYKGEMSFFWYKVKAVAAGLIATMLIAYAVKSLFFFGFSFGTLSGLGAVGILELILGFFLAIYAAIAMFSALKGIASAYNANLFNIAAWLYLAALLTMIFGIGAILMAIYSILLIIAYVTIQDVAISTTTVYTPTITPTQTQTQPQAAPVSESEPVQKEETVTCPQCQCENLKTAKFCTNCGGPLVKEVVVEEIVEPKCSVCGRVYADGSKFCEEDGGKIV